jgi:hypothetical protein
MTISRINAIRRAEIGSVLDEPTPQLSNDNARSSLRVGHRFSSERGTARMGRDVARGYSINVKQVVLEFLIIGLILTSQYLTVDNE